MHSTPRLHVVNREVRERPVALRRGEGLVPGALPPVGNTEDVAEGLLRRVWNPRVAQSNPAMKLRTLSAPMCLSTASAPVLSLWLTIASSAVRSLTRPERYGGLKTALSSDQILSSSLSWVTARLPFDASFCRSASPNTKALNELPQNRGSPGSSSAANSSRLWVAGAKILIDFVPGSGSKRPTISAASLE